MGNNWIEALKEYNKGHNMWCVVKKGTPEYDEVKKIMEKKKPIKTKDDVVIYDRRTSDEIQRERKEVQKLVRQDSRALKARVRQIINPSNKSIKEVNKYLDKYLDKLPKKENNSDDYDLSKTKRKKKSGAV